jgi:FkbM family methyltransferase
MYHSEFCQDKWLNENVFHGRRDGVFFEAGALDGVMDSNTLFFEEELWWTGILVEPNPDAANRCRVGRRAVVETMALSDSVGEKPFLLCDGGLFGWSGLSESIEDEHAARIEKHVKSKTLIKVPCEPLQSILARNGIKRLDYCVLDIEGAEWPVLMAYDWSVPVEVFEIEDNFGKYPIDQFMEQQGYEKLVRLGVSNLYRKDIDLKMAA